MEEDAVRVPDYVRASGDSWVQAAASDLEVTSSVMEDLELSVAVEQIFVAFRGLKT